MDVPIPLLLWTAIGLMVGGLVAAVANWRIRRKHQDGNA